MSQPLDALTFPLWGSRLIEASAGTGKTWTIAALYLRLVLGHGGEHSFERPLLPSEILVMTFTRAATRELSNRIRTRLVEAARLFRDEPRDHAPDALLTDLTAAHPPGPARTAGAWRLAMAAESMDDAAVHTIDAWCQRMLREHAFDSGCLFDEELVANLQAMQHEAVQDYWRQQVYPLDGDALDTVLAVWPDVHALADDMKDLIEQSLPSAKGEGSLADLVAHIGDARARALAELRQGWADQVRAIKQWLDTHFHSNASPFNKTKIHPRYYDAWLAELGRWSEDTSLDHLALTDAARSRLTPEGIRGGTKDGVDLALPSHFGMLEQLLQALDALPPLAPDLRTHAAVSIAQRLTELKRQAGTFGFADMLSRLDRALDPAVNGANAERLRERILAQYPVALIDEFQDTSPVQSRIFDRLYRIDQNDRGTALLLIGDPKQSIYGFRGADIHSYLHARRATQGRHYALSTNHRSTHAMVAAANHLFETAEAREGEGAFMFRGAEDPLPFAAVSAQGRSESFVTSDGTCPAMTLHLDDRLLDAEGSRRVFAARCAERIASLLNDARAGFDDPVQGFARLRPGQVAVLVRTGREAALVRRELRRRRIASVYLSDKESVFQSAEARDLLHWLRAVAAPLDARLVRAALATRTVGLSIDELLQLAQDDTAFDARSEQMRGLHGVWREQGVLTMLRCSMHLLQLPARWLGSPDASDGERRLTNLLHLAELLQAASVLQEGEQALVRWFAGQLADPTDAKDDEIVRLESDADLVQVVTVHKAKGLEYPLVFLPFASGFRPVEKKNTGHLSLTDAAGNRSLHLDVGDAQIAIAERERQREDLRLLYVAITRARHVAWVGLSLPRQGRQGEHNLHLSALGYAVAGTVPIAAQALEAALQVWARPCDQIAVASEAASAPPTVTLLAARAQPLSLRSAPAYAGRFERRWSIGSFSAVVRDIGAQPSAAWATAAARDDERTAPAVDAQPIPPQRAPAHADHAMASAQPWHTFPRGSTPGNFLHDQLEWLAGEGFDLNASVERQQQLLRRCERQGWGHRRDDALAWLRRVVATPLPAVGAALEGIAAPLAEMEFWFPSDGLVSSHVDALCRRHLLDGRARPSLPEHTWRGMLMGFADLVFEQGGRYWVLDYKSNYLGPADGDYGAANLENAMAAHRYDVQAAIYLLALHRLLKTRLGAAYEPSHHLGGAVFFFLRGLDGPTNGCCRMAPPLTLLDALDDTLRDAAGSTA